MYAYANGKMEGGRGLTYVKMAEAYGPILALTNYGGFITSTGSDPSAFAKALNSFEQENHLPPLFIGCYDEPATNEAITEVLATTSARFKAGMRTTGYTGAQFENALWVKLMEASSAPAANNHGADWFAKIQALGGQPWVYNQGRQRANTGLRLWRQIKLGCKGRFDWIGFNTQGFAFDNLDGREPSNSCFALHRSFGALKTPLWLARREGLLDCRLRLTLEKVATTDDPALALWTTDGYRTDSEIWKDAQLEQARTTMLKRLSELTAKQ
jgi:hypothetical protein